MRLALVRGATAGTLAALLLAMVWILTTPTERRATAHDISVADRNLAAAGITVVAPPSVNESVLDNPSRALTIAGVSLAIGVLAGAALSGFDNGKGNWPVWMAMMAVPTLGLAMLFVHPTWRGMACWGAVWVPLGVSSWWTGRSATA